MAKENHTKSNNLELARRAFQQNSLDKAISICEKLLSIENKDSETWFLLGNAYARQGRFEKAGSCFRNVISIQPESYTAFSALGLVLVQQGKAEVALPYIRRATEIQPLWAQGHVYMGCLLRDLGQEVEALNSFARALDVDPESGDALLFSGHLHRTIGNYDDAELFYSRLLKQVPNHAGALAGRASVFEKTGRFQDAYKIIRELIDTGQTGFETVVVLSALSKRFNCQEEAIVLLNRLLSGKDLLPVQQAELLYILARLNDQLGRYDSAFEAAQAANTISPMDFDKGKYAQQAAAIVEYFSSDKMVVLPSSSIRSERPVFIVGMPRSGTSLVEQILASHPKVFGAGEYEGIAALAMQSAVLSASGLAFPACLDNCDQQAIDHLASRYHEYLKSLSRTAARITNKLPANYLFLGFIEKLFPDARIIHCVRNPMDTCLSCHFQSFGTQHMYTKDQADLAFVYHEYQTIMKHWHENLSLPILDISYEDMVGNVESMTRVLLKFCGLDWDEKCLEFYKSSRSINTASYDQVRYPVYADSIGKWKKYASHLMPLQKALWGYGIVVE